MKKILLITVLCALSAAISAQEIIATSNHTYATWDHNQRKLVRDSFDNICVVFSDYQNGTYLIKGVMFDRATETWGAPFEIAEGNIPTLAINRDDQFHLLYQSNDSLKEIRHMATYDFLNWPPHTVISEPGTCNRVPVADVDSASNLNIMWRKQNSETSYTAVYARISNGQLAERKDFFTREPITDIALANHLLYYDNQMFFAISFGVDSLALFHTSDWMETHTLLYETTGNLPGITYNSEGSDPAFPSQARFVYRQDFLEPLREVAFEGAQLIGEANIDIQFIDNLAVDDLVPGFGYSMVCRQGNELLHVFSYGPGWDSYHVMETISAPWSSHPSVAYKHFSFEYVDFIWAEQSGSDYNIKYMRDPKHVWTSVDDPDPEKGFTVTGQPNPFRDFISLNIEISEGNDVPVIEVFNTSSQVVQKFTFEPNPAGNYALSWDGHNFNGEPVNPGVYVFLCTVGNKRAARKVVYQP